MSANPSIDHVAILAEERARYAALSEPERAWVVTNAAALRFVALGEDAGLLDKPSGANWLGYAMDIICYRDGTHYDCLVAAGERSDPAWQFVGTVDPARWRPPVGNVPPPPSPSPDDGQVCEECKLVLERLDVLVDAQLRGTGALLRMLQVQEELLAHVGSVMRRQGDGSARVATQVDNRVKVGW